MSARRRSNEADARTRVLHVVATSARAPYFQLITRLHDRARFDLRVATLADRGALHADFEVEGLRALALATSRRGYPRATLSLAAHLRAERIDVVHAHLFDACVVGLAAARLARVPVAMITAHHTNDLILTHRTEGAGMSFLLDRISNRWLADCIVAPSAFAKNTLVAEEGIPPSHVEVIPLCFDANRFAPDPAVRTRTRAALGMGPAERVFIAIGRLHRVKNYALMLRSFARLAGERADVRLLIAGDGPEESSLRTLAATLGLDERVRWLGARTDVPDLLAASDVFVHTSLTESFNQALIEAMLSARPVITTPVGIAHTCVRDGEHGAIVQTDDENGVHAAMRAVLDRHTAWAEIGVRNRATAQQFSAESMVRQYEELYDRLLTGRRAPIRQAAALER